MVPDVTASNAPLTRGKSARHIASPTQVHNKFSALASDGAESQEDDVPTHSDSNNLTPKGLTLGDFMPDIMTWPDGKERRKKRLKTRFMDICEEGCCKKLQGKHASKEKHETGIMLLGHDTEENVEVKVEEVLGMEDKQQRGHWVREEAAVDSGSVDIVINRDRVPHLEVKPTPESERGETWTGAGGQRIKKEGEAIVQWFTEHGRPKKMRMKVGRVGRTLISVSRLNDSGYDTVLTSWRPHIVNRHTGEVIPLRKVGGMYILNMWIWVPGNAGVDSRAPGNAAADFRRQQ